MFGSAGVDSGRECASWARIEVIAAICGIEQLPVQIAVHHGRRQLTNLGDVGA